MSVNRQAADCWCEVSSRGHRVVWQWLTELLPPPSSPFSSYLSAGGLFPCHQACCIYNSGSSSCSVPLLLLSSCLTSSPSHTTLFCPTRTAAGDSRFWLDEPHSSACVSLWGPIISPSVVILGMTPFSIVQFYLSLCLLTLSESRFLGSRWSGAAMKGVGAHCYRK